MTLFRVEVRPPAGATPFLAEMVRAGPRIRHPIEGDRFSVCTADGQQHSGVVVEAEDLGVTRGGRLIGGRACGFQGRELRVVRLVIEPSIH